MTDANVPFDRYIFKGIYSYYINSEVSTNSDFDSQISGINIRIQNKVKLKLVKFGVFPIGKLK